MLIHPWDAALDASRMAELAGLAPTGSGCSRSTTSTPRRRRWCCPPTSPSPATSCCIHLARPNPVWPHLEAAAEVRLAVVGDYAYIPTYWRAKAGGPDEDGVPTSYYSAVQFVCRPTVVDDPQGKADILTAQLADFQPEGGHATGGRRRSTVRADAVRHPRRPAGGAAGGRQVQVRRPNPVEHRERVIGNLERARPRARRGAPRPSNGGGWPRSATGKTRRDRLMTTLRAHRARCRRGRWRWRRCCRSSSARPCRST